MSDCWGVVDTGITLDYVIANLGSRKPRSLSVCTLLSKPQKHKMKASLDFVGLRSSLLWVMRNLNCNQQLRVYRILVKWTNKAMDIGFCKGCVKL